MYVTYKKCDLCDNKIDDSSDELHIKYKAYRKTLKNFSIKDTKDKIPIVNWGEIDICENCLKEIIIRKHKKDKEWGRRIMRVEE